VGRRREGLDDVTTQRTTQKGEREKRTGVVTSFNSFALIPFHTEYFQTLTDSILNTFYPKFCPHCNIQLSKNIKNRPYSIRCNNCHYQTSRLSGTPLAHMRLPQWFFGWCIHESIKLHPGVLTASHIQRSLGVSNKTACLLKRRLQIFCSQQMDGVKQLIQKEMKKEFRDFELPPDGTDITKIARKKKIVHADTVVLFSASQRANKGRKNWKNRGLTASIYLQDRLGGKQIGTLVQVMGTEKGWCLLDSVPDQKASTLGPIIRRSLPPSTAIFTDEAYTWLYRVYRNHRMVNHNLKSEDSRWKFSRQRWCRNGVHSQVAEGLNGSLKKAMRSYCYFRPEYSRLYLDEWSFFKNLKYFGFEKIAHAAKKNSSFNSINRHPSPSSLSLSPSSSGFSRNRNACGVKVEGMSSHLQRHRISEIVKELKYYPVSIEERGKNDSSNLNGKLSLDFEPKGSLKDAMIENDLFWTRGNSKLYQRKKERVYQFVAQQIWDSLAVGEFSSLNDIIDLKGPFVKMGYRVTRRWAKLGLVEFQDLKKSEFGHERHAYEICRIRDLPLPQLLYMKTLNQYRRKEDA